MTVEHRDIDPTDPEAQRRMADLHSYATVLITLGVHPDDPTALATTIEMIEPGVPCFLAVARTLRSIADEFERRHGHQRCGR